MEKFLNETKDYLGDNIRMVVSEPVQELAWHIYVLNMDTKERLNQLNMT